MSDCAVVIATYNEAESIRQVLDGLRRYFVIVVDDNSPDGTGMIAGEYINATVLRRPAKMGVASAYLEGFRRALQPPAPRYVVQMDAGMTHDPADVPRLLESIETAHGLPEAFMVGMGNWTWDQGVGLPDLVIGSRFVEGPPPPPQGYRTLISLGAAWLMRRLGVRVYDATSGFRCWRASLLAEVLRDWEPNATGFGFQLEMLHRAWHLCGGRVVEEPIAYRLTNSSFRWRMVAEALRVYAGLWLDRDRRYW